MGICVSLSFPFLRHHYRLIISCRPACTTSPVALSRWSCKCLLGWYNNHNKWVQSRGRSENRQPHGHRCIIITKLHHIAKLYNNNKHKLAKTFLLTSYLSAPHSTLFFYIYLASLKAHTITAAWPVRRTDRPDIQSACCNCNHCRHLKNIVKRVQFLTAQVYTLLKVVSW